MSLNLHWTYSKVYISVYTHAYMYIIYVCIFYARISYIDVHTWLEDLDELESALDVFEGIYVYMYMSICLYMLCIFIQIPYIDVHISTYLYLYRWNFRS
jgi:hypothetical protein